MFREIFGGGRSEANKASNFVDRYNKLSEEKRAAIIAGLDAQRTEGGFTPRVDAGSVIENLRNIESNTLVTPEERAGVERLFGEVEGK